ncbi:hypothetical protein Fcan01_15810 [Folsomia candida]|uniref:Uncharacterized protein n=1 Tax=Folsomia candida TaxID=158441 RepID=A0A226DUH3_FOLCA|nr:hypothetical protein Fcan01_15810 [Folsomia candida]
MALLIPDEKGSEISSNINKVASFVAQLYAKLPFILTILCIPTNIDPLYYFIQKTPLSPRSSSTVLVRTVLLFTSWIEPCRVVALIIFASLFAINVAKRETQMWMNIRRRSNSAGLLFYRHIAILYTRRRLWTSQVMTLIFAVGFVMQVCCWKYDIDQDGFMGTLNYRIQANLCLFRDVVRNIEFSKSC